MPQQIQLRNGTAAQWTTANPVLLAGEAGVETDTKKFKVGDGTTAWNSLAYASGASAVTSVAGRTGAVTLTAADVAGVLPRDLEVVPVAGDYTTVATDSGKLIQLNGAGAVLVNVTTAFDGKSNEYQWDGVATVVTFRPVGTTINGSSADVVFPAGPNLTMLTAKAGAANQFTLSVPKALTSADISNFNSAAQTAAWTNPNFTGIVGLGAGAQVITGTPVSGNVVDVSKSRNTLSIAANTTVTWPTAPAAGTTFGLRVKNTDVVARTLTFPASFSLSQLAVISSVVIPAGATIYLSWEYDGSIYNLEGDPTYLEPSFYVGTFAGRPTGLANGVYFEARFTDLDNTRWYTIDTGTTWRPVGGRACIFQAAYQSIAEATGASPVVAPITGVTAGTWNLPAVPIIPAGLLIARRSSIDFEMQARKTGTAGTAATTIYMGTLGTTADPNYFNATIAAAQADMAIETRVQASAPSTFTIRAQNPINAGNGNFASDRSGQNFSTSAMRITLGTSAMTATDSLHLLAFRLSISQ